MVTQALEILGFTPTTPASLNGIGGGIRNRQNIASGTDNSKSTPTSARSKGQANVLSAASNNTYSKSKSPKMCICLGKQLCLSERLKSIFFEKFSLVYVVLHAHNLAICIKIQVKKIEQYFSNILKQYSATTIRSIFINALFFRVFSH